MQKATKDILSSLRSCLHRRGGTTKPEEDQREAAMATPWPSYQTEAHSQTQGMDCSCDEALWEAKEAHQWALEAAHMLELNIERLNKEADGTKCQCPHSHRHPWGRSLERHVQSLNWYRPERCMTFCKPEEGTPSDERPQTEPQEHLTRGQLEEGNLGPPPTLRPELEHFLEMPMTARAPGVGGLPTGAINKEL